MTRANQRVGGDVTMTRLCLENKITAVYEADEEIRLLLTLDVKRPVPPLYVRLTVRTDADVGLATSWSEAFEPQGVGKTTIRLSLPSGILFMGSFYASIGVYRRDEIGNMLLLDHITRAFRFEISGSPLWNTLAHGYVQLPPMSAGEIK